MYGTTILRVYEMLRASGVTESERSFGRWLGRGPDYVRDHRRSHGMMRVSATAAAHLRTRLVILSKQVPPCLSREIDQIITIVDQGRAVAQVLAR